MSKRTCFVAMPIRSQDSDDHAHFRAIYEQVIKPTLAALDFETFRADEIGKPGAITRDIILALASADMAIVDLTDLNPNVFYELGVRHALRAGGTVMLLDELRTDEVPFDLGAYRVIQFRGDLTGIGKLAEKLRTVVKEIESAESSHRDNPVHDWIPSLPQNAVEASRGSVEGELREKLAQVEHKLRRFEQVYGKDAGGKDDASPLSTILAAAAEANEGLLPSDIVTTANKATSERNVKEFLSVIRKAFERNVRLSPDQFLVLTSDASNLGLPVVVGAIFDQAVAQYPTNSDLKQAQLAHFAHSEDPAARVRARQEILKEIGIVFENGMVRECASLTTSSALLLGVMLDAFHSDNLHDQALEITRAVLQSSPNTSKVLRNHARALENMGQHAEALSVYRAAILAPDADDTSMIWFGNVLHNEHRYVDAAEVYTLACLADPDDADGFAHLAEEIARSMNAETNRQSTRDRRGLPESIGTDVIAGALISSASCRIVNYKDVERMRRVTELVELDTEFINRSRMTRQQRVSFASGVYDKLQSELTSAKQEGV